jgi:DNA-binding winged helix-turn-helix (wHTH) protein
MAETSAASPRPTETLRLYLDTAGEHQELTAGVIASASVRNMAGIRVSDLLSSLRDVEDPDAMLYFTNSANGTGELPWGNEPAITFGSGRVRVLPQEKIVLVDGVEAHFPPTAFKLVELLGRNVNRALTNTAIIEAVWGDTSCRIDALQINIGYMRNSLGPVLGDRQNGAVLTIRGYGYKALESLPASQ